MGIAGNKIIFEKLGLAFNVLGVGENKIIDLPSKLFFFR
jgi:hypothetical protein